MSNWFSRRDDPDEELKAADLLLGKADALLRRHKGAEPAETEEVSLDDEELPILTDVVEDYDAPIPVLTEPAAPPSADASPAAAPAAVTADQLAEHLVNLDTEISREVEAWFANELPQLLSRELDRLSERLREEALAHLRATLLPALSERISHSLEEFRSTKG